MIGGGRVDGLALKLGGVGEGAEATFHSTPSDGGQRGVW